MKVLDRAGGYAVRGIAAAESGLDALRYRLLGRRPPDCVQILPYAGYRNAQRLFLSGRVIHGRRAVAAGKGTLSRMRTMLDIYESDEVPGVRLAVEVAGERHKVVTDEEGYFVLELDGISRPLPPRTRWETARISALDLQTEEADYDLPVLAPGSEKTLGVISDIDDTIIETGATNFLRNWRRVLVERPEERLAVPGAPELYARLALREEAPENPVFYVSSSPWNLYGFIRRFMDHNGIPHGPMFLKDYGITENTLISSGHVAHKIEAVERILSFYPGFRFLLLGDDGQKDPQVYAQVVRDYPDSVAGVFIRDVAGNGRSGQNADHLAEIEEAGVPVWLGETMEQAAGAAEEIGVLKAVAS
ncbi:App1 family protein [Parvularcula oceani]|uniref:App1 family protein n=1 Tax=Parvularcula oceani TaxID=1247963 RepID=UPI0006923E06|nr:phosphatase domain-containing protein [Parvularcula oceani]